MKEFEVIYNEIAKATEEINKTVRGTDEYNIAVAKRNITVKNAETAFLTQIFPKILDVINEYAGKRVGKKTEEKICTEIKNTFNCRVRFNHLEDISISTPYTNLNVGFTYGSVTVYAKRKTDKENYKNFDENGKLNKLSTDMFHMSKDYINNIDEYVNKKYNDFKAINAHIAELQNMIAEYNTDSSEALNRPSMYHVGNGMDFNIK